MAVKRSFIMVLEDRASDADGSKQTQNNHLCCFLVETDSEFRLNCYNNLCFKNGTHLDLKLCIFCSLL